MNQSVPRALSPTPRPIDEIAHSLGLRSDEFESLGRFKAKLVGRSDSPLPNQPLAKYVDVTSINPTPAGEGKTVVTIGLAMALCGMGKRAVPTLRQPSLAPVFGIKGGGAGGGKATLIPSDDINLHFTGDLHAVSAANNLLAAMIDNHLKRGLSPRLDPKSVTWRRVVDVPDKGLSRIISGLGDVPQAPLRETGFDLTAASEVMAILALSSGMQDLRRRLGRILIGTTPDGHPVWAEDMGAAGAMAALLRDAIRPNLVQTAEHTPAFVHAGPFGNIAHGNSSVVADQIAVRLAEYVVTESGFGADCGLEKFVHIKCRASGLKPDAEVLVCTVRAMKLHSGRFRVRPGKPLPAGLLAEDLDALRAGSANLRAHLEIVKSFGLPVVVAVNRFREDGDREIEELVKLADQWGAAGVVVSEAFTRGGAGADALARCVIAACEAPNRFQMLYTLELPLDEKIERIATQVYGAEGVDFAPAARRRIEEFQSLGLGGLPVCIAKTQYSLSHDPTLLGRPRGFRFPVRDIRAAAGAGYIYALAGEIDTMPGLPSAPAAREIDVDGDGRIIGLR